MKKLLKSEICRFVNTVQKKKKDSWNAKRAFGKCKCVWEVQMRFPNTHLDSSKKKKIELDNSRVFNGHSFFQLLPLNPLGSWKLWQRAIRTIPCNNKGHNAMKNG